MSFFYSFVSKNTIGCFHLIVNMYSGPSLGIKRVYVFRRGAFDALGLPSISLDYR